MCLSLSLLMKKAIDARKRRNAQRKCDRVWVNTQSCPADFTAITSQLRSHSTRPASFCTARVFVWSCCVCAGNSAPFDVCVFFCGSLRHRVLRLSSPDLFTLPWSSLSLNCRELIADSIFITFSSSQKHFKHEPPNLQTRARYCALLSCRYAVVQFSFRTSRVTFLS